MMQNYYTAITRARFGASLWTEDRDRLVDRLKVRSGEKTSALQGLGRIEKDRVKGRTALHGDRWDRLRDEQRIEREGRMDGLSAAQSQPKLAKADGLASYIAGRAQSAASSIDRWIVSLLDRSSLKGDEHENAARKQSVSRSPPEPHHVSSHDHGGGHDR